MKWRLCFTAVIILFNCSLCLGYSTDQGLIKINSQAATGECLPPFDRKPINVLRQNNIQIYTARNRPNITDGSGCQPLNELRDRTPLSNPDDPRLVSLARVISLLSSIGTGTMTSHQNTAIVFGTVRGPSRQCGDHIQLNPGNQNCLGLGTTIDDDPHGGTSNIALIAHEIGHKIANSNGTFAEYTSFVQPRCELTQYAIDGSSSANPRGEEFAEVLAAYVTNPGMFEGKGSSCIKAFEFMTNLFGETPENGHSINMTCESRRESRGSVRTPDFSTFQSDTRLRFSPRHFQEGSATDLENTQVENYEIETVQ